MAAAADAGCRLLSPVGINPGAGGILCALEGLAPRVTA